MNHAFNFEEEIYKALMMRVGVFQELQEEQSWQEKIEYAKGFSELGRAKKPKPNPKWKSLYTPWREGKICWPLIVFGFERWNDNFSLVREEIIKQIMEDEVAAEVSESDAPREGTKKDKQG